jgi:hypothetical protein
MQSLQNSPGFLLASSALKTLAASVIAPHYSINHFRRASKPEFGHGTSKNEM